jgi:hypothetical protein
MYDHLALHSRIAALESEVGEVGSPASALPARPEFAYGIANGTETTPRLCFGTALTSRVSPSGGIRGCGRDEAGTPTTEASRPRRMTSIDAKSPTRFQ